jgi:nicotinamidase-related amidase
VRDARDLGYAVCVLGDAVRAVNVQPDDEARAKDEMRSAGAIEIAYEDIAGGAAAPSR